MSPPTQPAGESPPTPKNREARYQFFIDRGGTFTDIVARRPDGSLDTAKLLSENPEQYADAAVAGIRQLLGLTTDEPIPLERIEAVKMGTTVATNALLERKGEPTVLFITRGFKDQLRIGYQNRPKLFEQHIRLPELLYREVVEVDERVDAAGQVRVPLDDLVFRRALEAARRAGYRSAAIVFMHAYRYPAHELRAEALARAVGFEQVSASHAVSPLVKLVSRGDTSVVDAYLSPILRRYVNGIESELSRDGRETPLFFMKSNGGLTRAALFQGKDAILSGPAGGIVATIETALAAGFRQVIGFDMGGTSTDVCHFSGESFADSERQFETTVAGVRLRAPMLSIHTVAAGGGSLLHFDGSKFRVLPDSAGANPGPTCYRRQGPLTITDCNVLLGRIQPDFFPRVFGAHANQALDAEATRAAFEALGERIRRETGLVESAEAIASGFLRVAVGNMANAIKYISVAHGHDVSEYTLACFGGAGGQHACLVAEELGMRRVFIHPLAGVLSALGMGLAEITATRQLAVERGLSSDALQACTGDLARLSESARAELQSQGVAPERIRLLQRVQLKYEGTDTALSELLGDVTTLRARFEAQYRARFAFSMPDRGVVIESFSVEAVGSQEKQPSFSFPEVSNDASPIANASLYSDGAFRSVPVYERHALRVEQVLEGPAIIADQHSTTVVDRGWRARVSQQAALILEQLGARAARPAVGATRDPVLLEVFNNLFMSIAERMGVSLQNTASSVNIKERLDFSCALFDAAGNLIANAPHMPVHLGSMGESIKSVIRRNQGNIRIGDVFALNDPYNGGTHLPDVTLVMPVFVDRHESAVFYVASRGHHADIGGITPGSMPPASRHIDEEGVLIDNFKLVEAGKLRETELRELLQNARYPARNPDQNIADLRAQIAACESGREELLGLVEKYGLETVNAYMGHVQDNAEESVRRSIQALRDGDFETSLDSGAKIRVAIRVDHAARSASIDFTGTSAQSADNFNAPSAIVYAAVLYVFRSLVSEDIPLNAGCLRPLTLIIPPGSLLDPKPPAATVAGNVETSQVITDALYAALGILASSQGTMNNLTFGNARYQYYETIAGGSGAGDGFDGSAAVQTHMTNSRLTDPEVLELRFPVLVEEHSIRKGSGGRGRFRGGDGALRRLRFLEPMTAAILANRRRVAPHGLACGQCGERGATWVERTDGTRQDLSYSQETEVDTGDVLVVSTPSGGGYGDAD